jgi:hypothetical protein
MSALARISAFLLLAVGLSGCVVYEPVPVNPIDQPWQAAMGALEDAGLTLAAADRATGTLRGTRGSVEGIIQLRALPDGRVEVKINTRDPENRDPGLSQRLVEAYNRRMGR